MASYEQRNSSENSVRRIKDLLRGSQGDSVVAISREDLLELARHHPSIRGSGLVERRRRDNGYWSTHAGHDEARMIIAEDKLSTGKLPNTSRLSQIGLAGFLQGNAIGGRDWDFVLQYVKFLYKSGYSIGDIAGAGLRRFSDAESVREALGDVVIN